MDFIKQILSERAGAFIAQLTSSAGFSKDQAERFVPSAVARVLDVVKSGKLDLASLLAGGSPAPVVDAVDTGALASEAGVAEGTAREGLQAIVPGLLDSLKKQAGGAEGVLGLLGGDAGGLLGKAAGLAGGLFGK